MNNKMQPWDATSFEELAATVTLSEVKQALRDRENSRLAHKRAYLRRSALVNWAKEHLQGETQGETPEGVA